MKLKAQGALAVRWRALPTPCHLESIHNCGHTSVQEVEQLRSMYCFVSVYGSPQQTGRTPRDFSRCPRNTETRYLHFPFKFVATGQHFVKVLRDTDGTQRKTESERHIVVVPRSCDDGRRNEGSDKCRRFANDRE